MTEFSSDITSFDGVEPIALRQPGAAAPVAVARTLRRRVTTQEAQESGGAYTAADVKWRLSAVEHPDPPAVGAVVTDAGGALWTVLRVERQAVTQTWVCWCRRLELSAALGQSVTIQRATWSAGPSGAPVATWNDELTNVLARIQPVTSVIEVQHQRRTVRVTHKIYVAVAVNIDGNVRVVHGNQVYHVVGVESAERLGELPVLLAEATPWPVGSG